MIQPVCPHCKIHLQRRSQKGVFNYFCPSCYGFAVHFGGLKQIMGMDQVVALWNAGKNATLGKVACSHCQQPMKTVFAEPVELDLCHRCDLIWLDTGEWDDISRNQPRAGETPKVGGDTTSAPSEAATYGRLLLELEKENERSKKSGLQRLSVSDLSIGKCLASIVGIPTEEDDDTFLSTPWVTWTLIALCTIATFYTLGHEAWMLKNFSFMTDRNIVMKLFTVVTSFFIHGGLLHLVSNMYFLWIFGDNVEDHLGKSQYVLLLLLATFVGDFLFAMFHPGVVPLVGASGGISGVVAYYLCRFPHRRFVSFWLIGFYAIPGVLFGGLYLLKEVVGAFAEAAGTEGGVAHLAHLGGAAVGVLFAYILAPKRQLEKASKE